MQLPLQLALWIAGYSCIAAGLGLIAKRPSETVRHFLYTNRDLPFPVVAFAFLAVNCSAMEVLTMSALSARYGLYAVHFYWIGAVPAIVFLLLVMLPVYQYLDARSIPEMMDRRFGHPARIVSALCFCTLMTANSSITLCLFGRLLQMAIGCSFSAAIFGIATLTAVFVLTGGLTAVIYGELIQAALFVLVLLPLSAKLLHSRNGLHNLLSELPAGHQHTVCGLPWADPHSAHDLFSTFVGLGLILSFSYWCTDFLLVQRLLAARSPKAMRQTPLIALTAKMALPILLIVPGLAAARLYGSRGEMSFDPTVPRLLLANFSTPAVAFALATLYASLFIAFCGMFTASTAIFVSDVYAPLLRRAADDKHYLLTSRLFTAAAIGCSLVFANLALPSRSLMEELEFCVGSFSVPLATALILGLFSPRFSRASAVPAMLVGTLFGIANRLFGPYIAYGSNLGGSFYGAIVSCVSTASIMLLMSIKRTPLIDSGINHKELRQSIRAHVLGQKVILLYCVASCLVLCTLYIFFS